MKKTVNIILISCIILLQPRLWRGNGSIIEVLHFKKTIQNQEAELRKLKQRNNKLSTQINYIKTNPEAIEEQARFKLGMIKKGETYCQVVVPIE